MNYSGSRHRLFALLICLAAPIFAAADEPRVLGWPDLAPDMAAIENPFDALTLEQTMTFREYLAERTVPEMDHTVEQQERLRTLQSQLEANGFDPDELVRQYEYLVGLHEHATTTVRTEILEQDVELPGYLLPLNIKDGVVTEFLLVPNIGACIHEPAPPANQMVYVRFEKGFEAAGLYDPVWIRGRLKADPRSQSLYLVDGTSDVQVAYAMEAEAVWLF